MNDPPIGGSDTRVSKGRSRRPSLATVLSLIAIVLAMTTTAQALPGRNSVQTDDIQRGAVTTAKIGSEAVTRAKIRNGAVTPVKIRDNIMWALVARDGTLLEGGGVEAARRDSLGTYQVRFEKDVSYTAILATLYHNEGPGQINVAPCFVPEWLEPCELDPAFNGRHGALVTTQNSTGAATDLAFLLVAFPHTPNTIINVPFRAIPVPRGEAKH